MGITAIDQVNRLLAIEPLRAQIEGDFTLKLAGQNFTLTMEGPNTSIPDCETIELDGEATVHLPPAEWEATLNPLTLHNAVGRFSEAGEGELLAGPSRNFQVFDPLDFLTTCPP